MIVEDALDVINTRVNDLILYENFYKNIEKIVIKWNNNDINDEKAKEAINILIDDIKWHFIMKEEYKK